MWFGLILDAQSQTDHARGCFVEALDVFRRGDDTFWTARAATNLGRCLACLGDVAAAVPLLEEALLLRRRIGDQRGVANTLHHLADALERNGELLRAQALADEALAIARTVGDRFVTVRALIGLGRVAYARRELDSAADYLDQALTMAERDGFGHEVAEVAGVRALVARDAGCSARAAELGRNRVARSPAAWASIGGCAGFACAGQYRPTPASHPPAARESRGLSARVGPHGHGGGARGSGEDEPRSGPRRSLVRRGCRGSAFGSQHVESRAA